MSGLDEPVWASLSTLQADLSEGDDLARRYRRDINLFAAARNDDAVALESLAPLVGPAERLFLLQRRPVVLPPGLAVVKRAFGVQMVHDGRSVPPCERPDVVPLGDRDADEMLALAGLTEPGPFLPRTHRMGRFFGVRLDGRLVAMAGERMRFPGHTEISGVCTHPAYRGRGLARSLSLHAARLVQQRGETPFLHAWKTNAAAIRLYEQLGFERRCDMHVAVVAEREND